MEYAAFLLPAFFVLMAIEYWIAKKQRIANAFQLESAVSNISIGIAERVLSVFISFIAVYGFTWIYDHGRLFDIPNTWYWWVIILPITDFIWYWYHRLCHEINILWGAHIVHHQSEEFNFTVAARITIIQALIRNVFWCALPLIGFPVEMILVTLVAHGAYSFFTHTRTVGKLGVLEKILITPSHHRVHHASNEKYINKNYGDVFVIWDKWFGTFESEEEEPKYGIVHPLKSKSFLWQHFHYYFEIWEALDRKKGWKYNVQILFGKPEQMPVGMREIAEEKLFGNRPQKINHYYFTPYLKAQLFLATILGFAIIFKYPIWSAMTIFFMMGYLFTTLINMGALMEQKRWIIDVELIRLLFLSMHIAWWLDSPILLCSFVIVLSVLHYSTQFKELYWKKMYPKDPH